MSILQRPTSGPVPRLNAVDDEPSANDEPFDADADDEDLINSIGSRYPNVEISESERLDLEALFAAVHTISNPAFTNAFRIYPGDAHEFVQCGVSGSTHLLLDTGAMRGSYGDTAFFDEHPHLCSVTKTVRGEATLADGVTKVAITRSVLVTLDIFHIESGHTRGNIWIDLMQLGGLRELIIGAPELVVFYPPVLIEHLVYHRPTYKASYERFHAARAVNTTASSVVSSLCSSFSTHFSLVDSSADKPELLLPWEDPDVEDVPELHDPDWPLPEGEPFEATIA